MLVPDYSGGGLVNLVAELERRLTGTAPMPGLSPALAALIPEAESYLLVLFDGLGDHQLGHPAASSLAAARAGTIDAPFPTTTTVSLATIATGSPPAVHGLLGYQLWLPETDRVVNTIKWTTLWGERVPFDYDTFLPAPNTWERIAAAGLEPVVVQPFNFRDTPLTRVLYRGCRWEPWYTEEEAADAAAQLASVPGRLVLLYVPHVDFAAHVSGQDSQEYADALRLAGAVWERAGAGLGGRSVMVGTADHGHVDVPVRRRHPIPKPEHDGRIFAGDPRAVFVHGEGPSLAAALPATWVPRAEMAAWWGPGTRHPAFDDRAPDGILAADPGHTILHRHADERLIGQHGGLMPEELRIPLLVASR